MLFHFGQMTSNYVAGATWREQKGWVGLEAEKKGAGIGDSAGWGDFVTEKETARWRGQSVDLVWRGSVYEGERGREVRVHAEGLRKGLLMDN